MTQTATDLELAAIYRNLLLPRLVEEKMLRLLRQGRLSKWFSGIGQEAIAIGVVAALEENDFVLPLHRNLGIFTTRGVDLDRLLRQLLGREGGFTAGRDRSFHFGVLEHGIVGMISHLGAMLPVACGLALAGRLRGSDRIVAVFSGDGGTSEGDFHEALNLASVWRLPVVFVVENNGWGLSTPTSEQYACRDLADRGPGYGMPGAVVDGNDVLAVVAAVGEAAERARLGEGPTLREAMRADERVVLLGQDIAGYGGAFKVTDGFVAEFGRDRVRNTPIIESGALGCALGLALDGFHPMVEMQFGDFISCGFNQVVNNLATTHYRWGAPVPVVIRAPVGGGMGAGPFHSQNVEGYFANVPGLRIVSPATPADAKGLLLAAFDDSNPVLYLEHKALYRTERGPVPAGWHTVPFGTARIARPGRDATVVTYGIGVRWALEAAGALADDGAGDIEVIDLRSLRPWDEATVLASVERTGRCLLRP